MSRDVRIAAASSGAIQLAISSRLIPAGTTLREVSASSPRARAVGLLPGPQLPNERGSIVSLHTATVAEVENDSPKARGSTVVILSDRGQRTPPAWEAVSIG